MTAYENLYINGQWVPSAGTDTLSVTDSATEEVIATIPEGTASDVDAAVAAAKAAFPAWSALPKEERAAYLMKIHAGLEARTDEIASTIAKEVGMPLFLSNLIRAGLPKANFAIAAQLLGSSSLVRVSRLRQRPGNARKGQCRHQLDRQHQRQLHQLPCVIEGRQCALAAL